jgi:hypothetical protein
MKSSKFDFVLLANRGRIFLNTNDIKNVNAIPPAISIRASGTCVRFSFFNYADNFVAGKIIHESR